MAPGLATKLPVRVARSRQPNKRARYTLAKTNQAKQLPARATTEHTPGAHDKPKAGPAGYKKVEDGRFDIAGHWMSEAGAIHGVLVGGYEFIQKSGVNEGKKARVLVMKLIDPCMARVKLEGGGLDETELSPGELCGIFYKAGLRDLLNYAGCKVFVKRNPESEKKKTKRGAMWTFTMSYEGTKRPLAIRPAFTGEDTSEDTSFDPSSFGDVAEIQ